MYDIETKFTSRVSVGDGGVQLNGDSFNPIVSGDGKSVLFVSFATNVTAGTATPASHLYVFDTRDNSTRRVTASTSGTDGNAPFVSGRGGASSISYDGRYIAFESNASNLLLGDTNAKSDIFVLDRGLNKLVTISSGQFGSLADGDSTIPSISPDGRYIVTASNDGTARLWDARNGIPLGEEMQHDGGAIVFCV